MTSSARPLLQLPIRILLHVYGKPWGEVEFTLALALVRVRDLRRSLLVALPDLSISGRVPQRRGSENTRLLVDCFDVLSCWVTNLTLEHLGHSLLEFRRSREV